jgi:hypothetical protein
MRYDPCIIRPVTRETAGFTFDHSILRIRILPLPRIGRIVVELTHF